MSVIYLKHPKHGKKVAISEMEAVADEENGWERYQVAALLQPSSDSPHLPVVVFEEETIDDLRRQWEEKHGKKPHHRKSIETLRAEV